MVATTFRQQLGKQQFGHCRGTLVGGWKGHALECQGQALQIRFVGEVGNLQLLDVDLQALQRRLLDHQRDALERHRGAERAGADRLPLDHAVQLVVVQPVFDLFLCLAAAVQAQAHIAGQQQAANGARNNEFKVFHGHHS